MITLKDLPGIPAGSEITSTGSVFRVVNPAPGAIHEFSLEVVSSNPDWFGQVIPSVEPPAPEAPKATTKGKAGRPKKNK